MKHLLLLCSFFVLALVACGPDRSSPEAVVNAFCTAVAAGDAEQACSFIHPDKPALCDRVNGRLNELQSKFETGWEIRGIEPSERTWGPWPGPDVEDTRPTLPVAKIDLWTDELRDQMDFDAVEDGGVWYIY